MTERFKSELTWADVTPKAAWMNRRSLIAGAGALGLAAAAGPAFGKSYPNSKYSTDEKPNTFQQISNYNNYYEFGTSKSDPAQNAGSLTTDPWSVEIGGLVDKPGKYDLADLLKGMPLQERIYRHRCVEAWSMVIPWIGFQLSDLLDKVGVQPSAKYIYFETLMRPSEMPGQKYPILDWPYREGLRMDEAMNPLTILVTGLYGDPLPNQDGAPIRLAVPWKYGFKHIKSIVKISAVEKQPLNTWQEANSREYGFYANVNPKVDHPRWSQATERRIGGGLFAKRIPTLPFNGYGKYVASMYAGMDPKKLY